MVLYSPLDLIQFSGFLMDLVGTPVGLPILQCFTNTTKTFQKEVI